MRKADWFILCSIAVWIVMCVALWLALNADEDAFPNQAMPYTFYRVVTIRGHEYVFSGQGGVVHLVNCTNAVCTAKNEK